MTRKQFLAWGERWHYMGLVLAPKTDDQPVMMLKHGKEAYEEANKLVVALASLRIRQNRLLPELQVQAGLNPETKPGKDLDYFRQHQARKIRERKRRYASGVGA
jgi:hypothetical protein